MEQKKLQLVQSEVVFNQEEHTYQLGDKKLSGITSTLIAFAFPDTYAGVSEKKMKEAADHGSVVHETVELFETLFEGDKEKYSGTWSPELTNYIDLKEANHLTHQAQEYLVSDNELFASAIDIVFTNEKGEIVLSDIKTTSKILTDHVSLQLSIYAMLFEKMNPDLKVSHLSCMWLHDFSCKYVEVPRVSENAISKLIQAYLNEDKEYRYEVEIPEDFITLEEKYIQLTEQVNIYTEKQNEVKKQLMELMDSKKMKSVKTPFGQYSYVPATTQKRFDSKRFKEENPEAYDSYMKESMTQPQIRIKLKPKEEQK